jgi:hypothetical protein
VTKLALLFPDENFPVESLLQGFLAGEAGGLVAQA